ncbi:unnamed protein product [Rotaria socialis]
MTSFLPINSIKPIRKRRIDCPNDHIMVLVKELYNDAKANGAQTVHCYRKALQSLEKYPLRIETGSDCRILHGFGEKICEIIDQKLNVNKKSATPTKTLQKTVSVSSLDNRKKPSTMINLSDDEDNRTDPPPAKQAKISNETRKITKTIKKTSSAGPKLFNNNNPINVTTQPTTISTLLGIIDSPVKTNLVPMKPVQTLKPGSFHVTLCIDNAEASRPTQKVLLEHLTKNSISFDVRKLNIGDFLWTIRSHDTSIKVEAILDYIIERKRLDDLSKSIIDGRYNEQKFRLKQCGITNLIYLVESLKNTNAPGILTPTALNQAIVNTQVAEDFFVREVSNPVEMANYLISMTKHLTNHFKDKTLHILSENDMSNNYRTSFNDSDHYVMTFESFNSGIVKSKPPTVKEMFARALMQIAGMSVDNVLALTEVHPTPSKLLEAYNKCLNEKERKLMLASIKKITNYMQEANRNTDLILQAQKILKDADLLGLQSLDVITDSSSTISTTIDKYILNEHLINTSRDLINQYERKAKYEKLIITSLLVVFFVIALNIMADDDVADTPPSSSRPFFVPGGFPFVFLPTTFTTGFSGANNHTRISTTDDQTKTESQERKMNDENSEEIKVVDEEAETVDNDEANRNNENNDCSDEKDDLRISQPKYSQLLRELDFSGAKMVDVTNLLSDELDEQVNDSISNGNENGNPAELLSNEKYESSSATHSSVSSDEVLNNQKSNTNKNANNGDRRTREQMELKNAADDIQNDLNNLAAVIQAASQLSMEEDNNNHLQKRHMFDEDDDTSKQATQNYDLNDNEQEEILPSSKSSKIPRLINQQQQQSNNNQNENRSFNPRTDTNRNIHNTAQNQVNEQQEQIFDWTSLVHGAELKVSDAAVDSHSTQKKAQEQNPSISTDEEVKPRMNQLPQQNTHHRSRQASSSSSSSDTGSVVQYDLQRSKQKPPSPRAQQTIPHVFLPQTLRQDSQATLIDENLDDLSSQIKQVLDQERQTYNTSTKEERTTDGIGSISMRLSTPDMRSTNLLDHETSNRVNDNEARFSSNQQRNRRSSDAQERSSPQRKKPHHHQRHATARHFERKDANGSRKPDDNWLNVLERLEYEHKTRLQRQQQQYEDQMHTLEDKMKRRFDDYLTLTNGFQESRLDSYDDPIRVYPPPSTVPIDSNIGRYKDHSYTRQNQSLAKDLISHYYPADSTLNILTSEKKRSIDTKNHGLRSRSREDTVNLRTELSAIHSKHIADLKLYYEYEINELKSQLNRARMGSQPSSSTRKSVETIGRINSENIRLHDEVNELRHSLKTTEEENTLLKRQLEELREQLNSRDTDLKNYHHTIVDLEQQLTEAENTKERQDEKFRHADRQALLYREENEKIKTDLNLTRERLLRLEERYSEQELENETLRRQLFVLENDSNRINNNTTMALNQTTSGEYGRFAVAKTRQTSPRTNVLRDTNTDSRRYKSNDIENSMRHAHSPRPMTRISDYLNEKPVFPPAYVPPSRHSYSPRRTSPNRRRIESMANRTSVDRQMRQSEQLEQKFDQLLRKKRELEARLNRIPLRGLTNIDRQLYDVLEREIERVEEQISSVKLELRKLSVLRTH